MKIRSLRDAVAQMVMPRIEGKRLADPAYRSEMARLAQDGIGGFILFGGTVAAVRALADRLRREAGRPLLIAADLQRGAGQQVIGVAELPPPPLASLGGITHRSGYIAD